MDDYLWVLPTIRAALTGDDLVLRKHVNYISMRNIGKYGIDLINQLDGNSTERTIRLQPYSDTFLSILERESWLVRLRDPLDAIVKDRPWISRQLSYYAHHANSYPEQILDRLQSASVLIVGVGGIGSYVAELLAGSGVGHLILNDPDVVEPSNLNRQILYAWHDIGRKKVEVARERLLDRHPWLKVTTLDTNTDHDSSVVFPESDIVIVCGECESIYDRPTELVANAPIVFAGYDGRVGILGPLIRPAKDGRTWAQILGADSRHTLVEHMKNEIERRNSWNSSGATINGVVGSLLAHSVLQHLAPELGSSIAINNIIHIDMKDLIPRVDSAF